MKKKNQIPLRLQPRSHNLPLPAEPLVQARGVLATLLLKLVTSAPHQPMEDADDSAS